MHTIIHDKASLLYLLNSRKSEITSFGVKKLGLFGSFVQETNIHSCSDIDLLVEFEPGKKSFDNFMDLSFFLEELLGRKVELITPQSLSKHIGPHILKQVENVFF